jgi:hypothetical protein
LFGTTNPTNNKAEKSCENYLQAAYTACYSPVPLLRVMGMTTAKKKPLLPLIPQQHRVW